MHSYVQIQNSLLIVAFFAFLICYHVRFHVFVTCLSRLTVAFCLVTLSRSHSARSPFSVTEKMIWNHVKKRMRMNLESLLNPPLDK